MQEAGKSDEALKHLNSCDSHICDVLTLYEIKGSSLAFLFAHYALSKALVG